MVISPHRRFFAFLAASFVFALSFIAPAVSFAREAFPNPSPTVEQVALVRDLDTTTGAPGLTRPQVVSFQMRQAVRDTDLKTAAPLSGIANGLVLLA